MRKGGWHGIINIDDAIISVLIDIRENENNVLSLYYEFYDFRESSMHYSFEHLKKLINWSKILRAPFAYASQWRLLNQ